MKICIVIGKDYPHTGTYREVKVLLNKKYKIAIISKIRKDNNKKKYEVSNGLIIHRIKSKVKKEKTIFFRIIRLIQEKIMIIDLVRKEKPGVLHFQELTMTMLGIFLKISLRKPLIFDMRENYPELTWLSKKKKTNLLKLKVGFLKIFEKIACKMSDHILVVVDESKERLVNLGIEDKKITVVMNCEIKENFSENKINMKLKKDLESKFSSNFVFGYIGGFGYHRGLDVAIKSLRYIKKEIKNAKLIIVGNGKNYNELLDLVKKLHLENDVIFTGFVPHDHLPTYVSIFDIGIIPHISNPHVDSTIPNKIWQYMLMEKPQVVSSAPPLKRIATKTKCGLVFKSGDSKSMAEKIITLAKNRNLMQELGKNGRNAAVKRYNWDKESKKLVEIYREIEKRIC